MKKKISFCLLVIFVVSAIFTTFVSAAETKITNGFYNIGTKPNVVITPYATNDVASSSSMKVNSDGTLDTFYVDSNRMKVSYTVADNDGYYGVLLVEGSSLPTVDNAIFYIDQVSPKNNVVEFDVYPILPTPKDDDQEVIDLTLYISCSKTDAELVSIPLGYAMNVKEAEYTLGDVNNDGKYDVKDALIVLQIGIGKFDSDPNLATLKAAGDVNGDNKHDVKDALLILQRGIGKIDSFN